MKDIDENGRDMSVMAPKKKTDLADIAKKLEDEAKTEQEETKDEEPKKTKKTKSDEAGPDDAEQTA
jgi:hypothetical protein